ncbi:Ger(x)C family spore germination protein [Paenibacillus faecis]|uniref:Ger(X)C family spore germination protein n=1 Tax=Paenibacillus faecis TaxID=862114 RepID=A0A5D0CN83_9BACL|nr:Ger(x)C family spore germination protein [Paenibacillus faecis]TYA10107.1 Ger(x)C family spore germination protein [Paenibacillus faecis]
MKKIGISIVCLVLLAGCWDRKEINDVAFIVGSAIDMEDGGYRSTMQIAAVGQMGGPQGGGGSSGSKAWHVESAFGRTIHTTREAEQKHLSRILHFSHRRVLIVSDSLARQGVIPLFDSIFRFPQNRLSSFPLIAMGEAKEVLTAEAPLERTPAEMIRELAQMATLEPINMRIFVYSLLTEGIDPIAPAIRKIPAAANLKKDQKTTVELAGIAVFKHDKLATILEDRLATGLLLAMGQARNPAIEVMVPGEERNRRAIVLQISKSESQIRPKLKNGRIEMDLSLTMTANLAENTSDYDSTDYRWRALLERAAEQRVTRLVEDAVAALQKHKSDALGFGDAVHRRYRSHWARLRDRWEESEFPQIKVTVKSDVNMENDGALIRSLDRKSKELKPSS